MVSAYHHTVVQSMLLKTSSKRFGSIVRAQAAIDVRGVLEANPWMDTGEVSMHGSAALCHLSCPRYGQTQTKVRDIAYNKNNNYPKHQEKKNPYLTFNMCLCSCGCRSRAVHVPPHHPGNARQLS